MSDNEQTATPSIATPSPLLEPVRQLAARLEGEQRQRWQRGEQVAVEAYLTQYPALQADAEAALLLIYQEVVLREERGEAPPLAEYLRRFPQWAEQLRQQFEVHDALASGQLFASALSQAKTMPALAPPFPPPGTADLPAVPGYEVRRELGRGGMGVVYWAWQTNLRRVVALKMVLAGGQPEAEAVARFHTEAEAVARLAHPNIVQIHEVGQYQGRPYMALEYVDGGSLAQKLAGTPLPARPAARLLETLARAVHAAHQRGVAHRDLKPGNVLLTADSVPKITDFGLAKLLAPGEAVQTQTGNVLGTPSYMAPEQAQGLSKAVGPAADVYALGAILYEMLTGRPPFKAETPLATILQVRLVEPVPPSRLQPQLPRDLNTICLKCLAKEPARRYGSAEALAADLERWLRGEPIRARPVGRLERLVKWAKRKPTAAALWGVLLAAVLAGGAGWWVLEQQESRRREELARQEARTRQEVEGALVQAEAWQRQARWAEAEATLVQARSRLGAEGADDLRLRVERAQDYLALVRELDAIRLKKAALVEGKWDTSKAAPAYAAAFRGHGLDVLAGEEAALVRRIQASPVKDQLLAALEDWAGVAAKYQTRARLLGLAAKADPDTQRNRFRNPEAWQDRHQLTQLARQANAEKLSPALLGIVGGRLEQLGGPGVELLERGQERFPGDFWLNFDLANALGSRRRGRWDDAVGFYRAALAVRPRTAAVYNNLGSTLVDKKNLKGAIAAFRQAITLDPKYVLAHCNLGNALADNHDLTGAIAAYQQALALDPKDATTFYNLGITLREKGDLAGAIAVYKKATALKPKDAKAHNNLGNALKAQGDWAGAIAAYQQAIARNDRLVPAHAGLGQCLLRQGHFAAGGAATRRALDLLPPNHPWRPGFSEQLRQCEQFAKFDALLPALLKGEAKLTLADEQLTLAYLCQQYKKRYALAAGSFSDAFSAQPKLALDLQRQHRYNAARVAALAAAGHGADAATLPDKERAGWRKQARDWLQADLKLWTEVLEQATPQARTKVRETLQHWQTDPDLAGLRDTAALAKLPAGEREECRKLWTVVAALQEKAQGKGK
jgi:serine/threonine-protein kinase